jgi:hypothetical protein
MAPVDLPGWHIGADHAGSNMARGCAGFFQPGGCWMGVCTSSMSIRVPFSGLSTQHAIGFAVLSLGWFLQKSARRQIVRRVAVLGRRGRPAFMPASGLPTDTAASYRTTETHTLKPCLRSPSAGSRANEYTASGDQEQHDLLDLCYPIRYDSDEVY